MITLFLALLVFLVKNDVLGFMFYTNVFWVAVAFMLVGAVFGTIAITSAYLNTFPGTRPTAALAVAVLTVVTGIYILSQEHAYLKMWYKCIGEPRESFINVYKTDCSDDGKRFKLKLPQSDKAYGGIEAEQVSLVLSGPSGGAVDCQKAVFYCTNYDANYIFMRIEAVMKMTCWSSGQESRGANSKSLIWQDKSLIYVLQKEKSAAPNHYLVTFTAKKP
ncbi:hypothetical protein IJT17_10065 [bacterium]|nr:hypothetical protein [bacterium]